MSLSAPATTAPPPARVPDNEWTRLQPPALGAWQPTRPVSVVVPAYQAQAPLRLCLAALAAQSYPDALLQVIVADDGSEPPVAREESWPDLDVTVVRQEHEGFGAGRARNLGAAAADGEILVFLDADMVLEPRAIEAHARWHHAAADAATLGLRRHADFTGVAPADVREAAAAGRWEELLAGLDQWDVEWIGRHLDRTQRLTVRRPDLFRIVASGNLGVRAELFREIGGFHAFGIRGIEDTEFGYRLYTDGALLVPDEHSLGWHQGRSFFQGPSGAEAKEARRAKTANHIPLEGFRDPSPGRSYPVPAVVVHVPWAAEPVEQAAAVAASVLAGEWHDVVVRVAAAPETGGEAVEALRDHFDGDQRVHVATEPAAAFDRSPVQITLPPSAVAGRTTVAQVWDVMTSEPLGAAYLTVPGAPPQQLVRAVSTRALCRATRVAATSGEAVEPLIGELFGERWLAGSQYGVRAYGAPEEPEQPAPEPAKPAPRPASARPLGPTAFRTDAAGDVELRDRLALAEERVEALRSRRVVRLADAIGGLRRAAGGAERRAALRRLAGVFRGRA